MLKRSCLLLSCLLLCACDNFTLVSKDNPDTILKEKWATIDTTSVAKPPMFKTCRFETEATMESCFQKTLTRHIMQHVQDQTIVVTEAINDTIWIPIVITKQDSIYLETYTIPKIITDQIPDFGQLIQESISKLPSVKAAHTRGIPVTTKYKLPLVITIH